MLGFWITDTDGVVTDVTAGLVTTGGVTVTAGAVNIFVWYACLSLTSGTVLTVFLAILICSTG